MPPAIHIKFIEGVKPLANAEEFGKKLENMTKKISQKSNHFMEGAKLNAKINRLEVDIEEIQYKIGKLYYERYFDDENCEFGTYIQKINEIADEIHACEEKLLNRKGLRTCPICNAQIPIDDVFCGKCGSRLEPLCDDSEENGEEEPEFEDGEVDAYAETDEATDSEFTDGSKTYESTEDELDSDLDE